MSFILLFTLTTSCIEWFVYINLTKSVILYHGWNINTEKSWMKFHKHLLMMENTSLKKVLRLYFVCYVSLCVFIFVCMLPCVHFASYPGTRIFNKISQEIFVLSFCPIPDSTNNNDSLFYFFRRSLFFIVTFQRDVLGSI